MSGSLAGTVAQYKMEWWLNCIGQVAQSNPEYSVESSKISGFLKYTLLLLEKLVFQKIANEILIINFNDSLNESSSY